MKWLAVVWVCTTGCAGTFDLVLGDSYTRVTEDGSATGESIERIEYRLAEQGGVFECVATERSIERQRSVTRTYRRRNGVGASEYTGAALFDGLFGGLIAGLTAAACNSDQNDMSCWHMLWAAPFALDFGYAVVKAITVDPAVLVRKRSSGDRLGLGSTPMSQRPTQCESVHELRVGRVSGALDEARLVGGGAGKRTMQEGSESVVLGDGAKPQLTPAAFGTWIKQRNYRLWAVDQRGEAHPVSGAGRCKMLRAYKGASTQDQRTALHQACPPPKAPRH